MQVQPASHDRPPASIVRTCTYLQTGVVQEPPFPHADSGLLRADDAKNKGTVRAAWFLGPAFRRRPDGRARPTCGCTRRRPSTPGWVPDSNFRSGGGAGHGAKYNRAVCTEGTEGTASLAWPRGIALPSGPASRGCACSDSCSDTPTRPQTLQLTAADSRRAAAGEREQNRSSVECRQKGSWLKGRAEWSARMQTQSRAHT
jgi:hypothetical protein